MNQRMHILLAAAMALGTHAAFAQDAAPTKDRAARAEHAKEAFDKRFADADVNHDGKLSKDEAKAGMPKVYEHFDEIDSGKTGFVTKEQIRAEMKKMVGERRKRKE
jgi:hypothetical protein